MLVEKNKTASSLPKSIHCAQAYTFSYENIPLRSITAQHKIPPATIYASPSLSSQHAELALTFFPIRPPTSSSIPATSFLIFPSPVASPSRNGLPRHPFPTSAPYHLPAAS